MTYIIKFDENGNRQETYVKEEMTEERIQELLDEGYIEINEEDYQLLIGNTDGKVHIRKEVNGEVVYEEEPPYVPILDEVKKSKIAALKAERDQKEVLPIEYNGNSFDYDDKARDRINAAIIALDMAGAEATLQWTTADNTNATVTAQDLRNIIAAVAMRSNTLHEQYRVAKEAVDAAETKEEVEAVTLEGNADV